VELEQRRERETLERKLLEVQMLINNPGDPNSALLVRIKTRKVNEQALGSHYYECAAFVCSTRSLGMHQDGQGGVNKPPLI
jgi:hypothetical protein